MLWLAGAAALLLTVAILIGMSAPAPRSTARTGPTPTRTAAPSPTATATAVLTPSPTPEPLPTPTPIPPQSYIVQQGDTLLSIAAQFGVSTDELRAYNGMDSDIIVVGQEILIPPPTPTPGPTPTWDPSQPTPTFAPFLLHTVQRGETLSTLAEQYGVSVDEIRRANNLGDDENVIRAGQVLQIPQHTPTPVATPEVVRAGTPTPRPLYPAPVLLYPPPDAVFRGREAPIALQWSAVALLDQDESYRLILRCPAAAGPKEVIIDQKATLWRVPAELFPPPEASKRVCTWEVEIVRHDGEDSIVSQGGERRTFTWEEAEEP